MKPKTKRDFRSLDEAAQAEVRRIAFSMSDRGKKRYEIAELLDIGLDTLSDWNNRRSELESNDCHGKKRGRRLYEQRILTPTQEKSIKDMIVSKTPQELGLSYALWNRRAIQYCIQEETGTKVWLQTVSKYAQRWGLTPQRPTKYAYERNDEKIKQWLEIEYPKILKQAKKEDAEIHWEDETGVALSTFYARSYAPSGVTPTIKLPAQKGHISLIASITNRGDMRFMMYKGALDVARFITFLERLIKDAPKKVYLIADNLRVHKAKQVQAWEQKHSDKLKIFFPTTLRSTT